MAVQPRVSLSQQMPRMKRTLRRPEHNYFVKVPPFCLQPVMIAPVLAGETMKNMRARYRAVTDNVLSPMLGWWMEHYLYYVPVSALETQFEGVRAMFLSLSAEIGGNPTRTGVNYMKDDATGSEDAFDYLRYALLAIVQRYFRSEDALPADFYFGAGAPPGDDRWFKVRAEPPGWMDSFRPHADETGVDIQIADEAGTGTLMISEVATAWENWQLARMQGLTNQTWEEFLRTYNVRVPEDPLVVEAEELRYVRQWQLPANTVDPSTGTVKTAVFWGDGHFSADKDRFFREPGFLVMVVCARPKTYYSKQTSYAASQMTNAKLWLPATLWENSRVGIKELPVDHLIKDSSASRQFDVRDLLCYGDQFTNDLAGTDHNLVGLPAADANRLFPTDADIKALFADNTKFYVRVDGRADLTIATSVTDPEPVMSGS